MTHVDKIYKYLLEDILHDGCEKTTRSGDVISTFGKTARFNLKEGLPILTTRKVFLRGVIEELLWFLRGETNIKSLVEKNVHIWDADAYRYLCEQIRSSNKARETITQRAIEKGHTPQYVYPEPSMDEFMKGVLEEEEIEIFNEKWVEGDIINGCKLVRYGDLGPVYGKNWRSFGVNGIDQVGKLIDKLKNNPNDRRLLITGYNPDDVETAALPPCHLLYQFYTSPGPNEKLELSCALYCRSQDFLLGTVFNWVSAAILTHLIAHICDMDVGELIWFGGDVHVYKNQLPMAEELLERKGKDKLPTIKIDTAVERIEDFKIEDIEIVGYESDDVIKIPLSVGLKEKG